MIVNKLRQQRGWSQEQLAHFCGLSLRTIQRVEAGNKASLETLKSLASVFEVDIDVLTREVSVIDKSSEAWAAESFWVRMGLWGIRKRSHMVFIEYFILLVGVIFWVLSPESWNTPLAFICAYLNAKLIAHIDKKQYWDVR